MLEREVNVEQVVKVTVDETKFTPEFMQEFRASQYNFTTLNDHLQHLAQLYARGLADEFSFIEGYGPAKEMGIKFEVAGTYIEMLRE